MNLGNMPFNYTKKSENLFSCCMIVLPPKAENTILLSSFSHLSLSLTFFFCKHTLQMRHFSSFVNIHYKCAPLLAFGLKSF
jgi:hypothetical protein